MTRTLLAAMTLLISVSCAGVEAREEVLTPAMAVAWTNVSGDVSNGIRIAEAGGALDPTDAAAARATAAEIGTALDSLDRSALLPLDWESLRALAASGIDTRAVLSAELPEGVSHIGIGVAGSLHNRLNLFDRAMRVVLER